MAFLQAGALDRAARAHPRASTSRRRGRCRACSASSPARTCRCPSASCRCRRTSTRSAPTRCASSAIRWSAVAALTEDAAHEAALAVRGRVRAAADHRARSRRRSPPPSRASTTTATTATCTSWCRWSSATSRPASPRPTTIFEDTFFYEGNTHLPMEQHATVAVPEDDDRVTLYSVDPDAALPAPRADQGARAAGLAHPRGGVPRTAAASAARAIRSTTRSSPRRWPSSSAGR